MEKRERESKRIENDRNAARENKEGGREGEREGERGEQVCEGER